jgi:ribose 5-phosphate isomerase
LIADTFFEKIANPIRLATDIKQITGVIEHGFFLDFKPILILGSTNKPTQIIYT